MRQPPVDSYSFHACDNPRVERVTEFDVERARRDTPGTAFVTHLNNAGAALAPAVVTDAVVDHLRLEATIGGYEAEAHATAALERTYAALAVLLGCRAHELAVVENATRAWDMAFYAMRFGPGDRILTSRAEYASNFIAFLQVAARTGALIEVIDDDEHGQVDVTQLANRIDSSVKLVALTHVPTHGGLVNPAEEVGRIVRTAGATFLLDACQSAGQMPLDVNRLGCDILSLTGRKYLRAPRGTGVLYVSERLLDSLEPPFLDLRAATWTAPDQYVVQRDARRFETWEGSCAGKIGLGVAVDYALSWGLDAIEQRINALADGLRGRLAALDGVRVHDRGQRRCGIVTFTVEGLPSDTVHQALGAARINTSVSRVEYAQLDLPRRHLPDLVRASVHYYNTDTELDRLAEFVAALSRGA
jgi:cysteine desulfurase / selenocysteine lyase